MKRVLLVLALLLIAGFAWWINSGPEAVRVADALAFVIGPDGESAIVLPVEDDASVSVVFSSDGRRFEITADGRITSSDEKLALTLDAAAGTRMRAVLNGTASNGVLAKDALLFVAAERGGSIVRLVRIDLATGAHVDVPLPADFAGTTRVSVAPDGNQLAVFGAAAGFAASRMALLAADGARIAAFPAAPIAPVWLPDVGALLFQRAGGGVWRFHVPEGRPEFVVNGELPTGCARSEQGRRDLSDPFVLIEKRDQDGFLQIVRVQPFEPGPQREASVSTGKIDHFGLTVSADHRYFAYRQATLGRSAGDQPVEERIVVVDQQRDFRATILAVREARPAARDIGPTFAPHGHRLWFIAEGALHRIDLGD